MSGQNSTLDWIRVDLEEAKAMGEKYANLRAFRLAGVTILRLCQEIERLRKVSA